MDPEDWAERFAACGARDVVLVAKHHDGYCLWPTQLRIRTDGRTAPVTSSESWRGGAGGRGAFPVYVPGGLDWTFDDHPIGSFSDLLRGRSPRASTPATPKPRSGAHRSLWPSVLWNYISLAGDRKQAGRTARGVLRRGARRRDQRPLHAAFSGVAPRRDAPGRRGDRPACRPRRWRATGIVPPKPPFASTCEHPSTRSFTPRNARPGSACGGWTTASATTGPPWRSTSSAATSWPGRS